MSEIKEPQNMRSFFTIWVGQLISILGSGLTSFALGVWIFQQTGKATPFAITVLFGSLPAVLLGPVAGSVADRFNRKKVMLLADTGNALITLAGYFLFLSGQLEIWNIYVIALVGSVFSAFQEPAFSASVVMIVPKKDLTRANGLSQMSGALGNLVPPLMAGLLFGIIGLEGIFLIDFITYFAALGPLHHWLHFNAAPGAAVLPLGSGSPLIALAKLMEQVYRLREGRVPDRKSVV